MAQKVWLFGPNKIGSKNIIAQQFLDTISKITPVLIIQLICKLD